MPLSEHEQRILEEIERRLAEEDPRLVASVSSASIASQSIRRIRWAVVGLLTGFVLLLLFIRSIWFAVGGFAVMLASGLVIWHSLRRIGQEQARVYVDGKPLSVTSAIVRLAERLRHRRRQP